MTIVACIKIDPLNMVFKWRSFEIPPVSLCKRRYDMYYGRYEYGG